MVNNCSKRNSNWEIDDWMVRTEVKISMIKKYSACLYFVVFMMYDVYWYCQMKKKRTIMKILKKEWFIWKFWKKGGSREKEGGGGNEIHAPCACALMQTFNVTFYNEYASSV